MINDMANYKIKFSHQYKKFEDIITQSVRRVKLLQVIKVNYSDLSRDFIDYDISHKTGFYPLPKTDLILLLFLGITNKHLFPTLRRYTPQKFDYYRKAEGRIFEVKVLKT